MEHYLRTRQQQSGEIFDESRFGNMMFKAAWEHNMLGRSWDDISGRNHLLLTVTLCISIITVRRSLPT
jgi:hypothetical protein